MERRLEVRPGQGIGLQVGSRVRMEGRIRVSGQIAEVMVDRMLERVNVNK